MKKKITIALAVLLIIGLGVVTTLALLTDEDRDVNVMTVGNVSIEQIEEQRDENNRMEAFEQNKTMIPAVYDKIDWDEDTTYGKVFSDEMANVVDKFVTVKNTGLTDAYVRTIIAFEDSGNIGDRLHINVGFEGKLVADDVEIDGVKYEIYEFTYEDVVKPGETTGYSLKQLFFNMDTTSEELAAIDGTYEVLVVSQAVQAAGFDSAEEALNKAFGATTSTNHPWIYGSQKLVKVTEYESLQAAVDAATEPTTIILNKNITESEVKIGSNKNITIVGQNNVVFDGQFFVTGTLKVRNLTVTNKNASTEGISKKRGNAFYVQGEGQLYIDNSVINIEKATGITTWWESGKGTYVEVTNTTFNANGNRPIQSEGDITVDKCTFNDQYRYSIQLTAKDDVINFTNNTITQSVTSGKPTYALQLTSDYGNSNLTINVANNTIVDADTDDHLYVWEEGTGESNGFVDIDTITINGGTLVKLS